MERNLETEARNALDMITRHGIDGNPVDRNALKYGLEKGLFNQAEVDNAQLTYSQREARDALDMITRHGIDGNPVDRNALKYGLEKGLFNQDNIDVAQRKYEATKKR